MGSMVKNELMAYLGVPGILGLFWIYYTLVLANP